MFSLQSLITKGAKVILTQKLRVPHPSSGSVDSMFKIAAQAAAQCWPVPRSPRREQIAQSAGSATPNHITLCVQERIHAQHRVQAAEQRHHVSVWGQPEQAQ